MDFQIIIRTRRIKKLFQGNTSQSSRASTRNFKKTMIHNWNYHFLTIYPLSLEAKNCPLKKLFFEVEKWFNYDSLKSDTIYLSWKSQSGSSNLKQVKFQTRVIQSKVDQRIRSEIIKIWKFIIFENFAKFELHWFLYFFFFFWNGRRMKDSKSARLK